MLEHRLATCAAVAAFLLLLIGSMVNVTGSSLACPEALFICHGSLTPDMTGGVFYEHGHRLAAMTVGTLQIVLTGLIFVRRPNLRWLGWLLIGMVITQGMFGATTVALKLKWYVSTGHLVLGMSYFAMLVYAVFKTRPEPTPAELAQHEARRAALGPRTWIAVACVMVMFQVMLGGLVRHLGATLACIGMPACTADGTFLPEAGIQQLHMLHRLIGCVTAVITTIAAIQVYRHARSWPRLRMLVLVAPVLVGLQIALGVMTVLSMREVPIAVAHFAGAMSLWALWMSAWLMTAARKPAIDHRSELVPA